MMQDVSLTGSLKDARDEATRRNRASAEAGLTDRWCVCRSPAILAIGRAWTDNGNPEGVGRWLCQACFDDWKSQRMGE